VTGLVVTKLDGTAKGGVLVPIGRELGIPVRWIGVGESLDDLVPFDPELVVEAVFGDEASLAAVEERLADGGGGQEPGEEEPEAEGDSGDRG
jgi:fused signal recognition particle receptor